MNKIAIVSLSALLAACSSSSYTTDVTSESHREEYKVDSISEPVVTNSGMAEGIVEKNVQPQEPVSVKPQIEPTPQAVQEVPQQKPIEKKVVKMTPPAEASVAIIPPTAKQNAMNPRYGYTIQIVAVGSKNKIAQFTNRLPKDGQPVWENYKVVNGSPFYTVLYGDYATRKEALKAIAELPANVKSLKPFAKSIDAIKNSE